MAKIARKGVAHYIQHQDTTPAYVLLGVDLEEFNIEMNANVIKTANILGNTSTKVDKYEKQSSVEKFTCDDSDPLFVWLKKLIDGEKTLTDLETNVVHVDLYKTPTTGAYPAVKEDVVIEIVSWGGNTEGFQIAFNVHYTGARTTGTFNPTTKVFA